MKKIWIAILMAITLVACKKDNPKPVFPAFNQLPAVYNQPVTVNVDQSQPGFTIPENFEGLSYETGIFGESPEFLNADNTVLFQLIQNLGSGVLRIGGNSSDETPWTGGARTANTPAKSLTTSDIDNLA